MVRIEEFCNKRNIKYSRDELLSAHTSFKIGGPCDIFIYIGNSDDLKDIIFLLKKENIPYMIIGNGTNLLVHDEGIDGAVIRLCGDFEKIEIDNCDIIAGAAAKLADVCKKARDNSLTGLEFAYGIPGSAGGAVYMNAGAYSGETKDVTQSVTYLDNEGNIREYSTEELDFSYRHSIFKKTGEVILFARFSLSSGERKQIDDKMKDIMQRRIDKQPLEYPSAGSVFKRPPGQFAGTLIQECGLKGRSVGGAQVSEKHSGFIINMGNATCNDVLSLVKIVQDTVREQTGTSLEREMIDIGR